MCHIYDLCKFEEEARCETHKECKQAAREIHIKDILALVEWDDRAEFKKLKGKENSNLYHEVCHIYDLCKFEEEARCETHKECKQTAIGIHIKDILSLAEWDNRVEFKKLKGKDNTEDKYVEAGNTWDLENATKKHISKTYRSKGRHSCNKPLQK